MTSPRSIWRVGHVAVTICVLVLAALTAVAGPTPSLDELIGRLREGGYVLVMRHASSPREAPSKDVANADNMKLERQLDEAGRRSATAMGRGDPHPSCPDRQRAHFSDLPSDETVRLARFASPTTVDELGDGGQSMQGISEAQAAWLRARVMETPLSGITIHFSRFHDRESKGRSPDSPMNRHDRR